MRRAAAGLALAVPLLAVAGFVAPELASRVGDEVIACFRDCASTARRRPGPLRIVTFNVFHGFPDFTRLQARLDLIARGLQDTDADLVFLQEVSRSRRAGLVVQTLAQRTGRNYVYVRANGNYDLIGFEEGVAILSRFPLRDAAYLELPEPGLFEHRVALAAMADTPWGPLRLATTHLAWSRSGETNSGQLRAFLEFVKERGEAPAIIAGDFNARDHSPHMRALAERWLDAQGNVDPAPPFTCCRDGERLDNADAGSLFARVDYVFLGPAAEQWAVTDARPLFHEPSAHDGGVLWASNHTGVYVEALPAGL